MILKKNRILYIIFIFFIVFLFFINMLCGQKSNPAGLSLLQKEKTESQDSSYGWKKRSLSGEEPDTNFTWEKYAAFLNKISDTSKYIVLPLREFRQTFNSRKIVIGLRHDIDNDLNVAYQFSEIEYKLGFRSTYFVLHTAPYYLANENNMNVHSEKIIPILKTMQDKRHFEIGWHNDLVTLQIIYNINPVTYFHNELNWLRSNGINIVGTASHGSNYCKTYHYLNYYFFEECSSPVVTNFNNNVTVPVGNKNITLIKGKLNDFGLQYEAYFLNNNKYYSDAKLTNGVRWNIGMLDLNQLQAGDRVIILLHPIHWHKGSEHADIESFSITGQKSCSVDTLKSTILVVMPYGTNRRSLLASFTLSPGAYVKVDGNLQVSNSTLNNFSSPMIYKVYAENRTIIKAWTINVLNAKNTACDVLSFAVTGLTKSVTINSSNKSILIRVDESADLKHLPVQFEISPGATLWTGKNEILKNSVIMDFSRKVEIRVQAEDGITSELWKVAIKK